jgi:superfamily I DNA/RNA helicase
MEPTEQQKLIIDYDGNAVVIAAPGSGKTFVLSEKIKLNLKELFEHNGVIAISYTNKASLELKNRSLSKGENPLSSFFGTIDKFNLSEIIIPFAKQLFGIPNNDFKIIKITDLPNEENEFFKWFDRGLKLEQLTEDNINIIKTYFINGLIMIETIGVFANYVFTNSKACRNYIKAKYTHLYIDEYQDSGFEQHEMFLKINQLGIKSIAVGDLNQSIYAFSGKDAKHLEDLTQSESFKYFKLDKNHRSHSSIINYSNYLLNPKTELIPTEDNCIWFSRIEGNEIQIANWIDKNVDNIQKCFKIENRNQIAILAKSNRTCEIINTNLIAPHRILETTELDSNLNIWSSIFSNLLHFCFDKNFKFIEVVELFTTYDKFKKEGLKNLNKLKIELELLFSEEHIDLVKVQNNLIKIVTIIAPNSKNEGSIELLNDVLNNPLSLKSYHPTDKNEINILTLHKSKGLEYDVVIHLDLYEWILPNKKPGPNNDFSNPIYGDWKQDINLHYVGITRARKGCFLISSTKRTNYDGNIKNGKDSEFIWNNDIEKLRYKKQRK